jgi:hypothetical protein
MRHLALFALLSVSGTRSQNRYSRIARSAHPVPRSDVEDCWAKLPRSEEIPIAAIGIPRALPRWTLPPKRRSRSRGDAMTSGRIRRKFVSKAEHKFQGGRQIAEKRSSERYSRLSGGERDYFSSRDGRFAINFRSERRNERRLLKHNGDPAGDKRRFCSRCEKQVRRYRRPFSRGGTLITRSSLALFSLLER